MARFIQQLLCRKQKRNIFFAFMFICFYYLMNPSQPKDANQPCFSPRKNLVYIKMIKCASETLSAVFRRYAYTRNLSIVLPLKNHIYLGWPYKMDDFSYRPSKTGGFNFLVDHSIFDDDYMTELMPSDTVFVTSIREPYAQFKSMFNYYNLLVNSNMSFKVMDPITEYLHNLDKYETTYKSHAMANKRYCIPDGVSMTKNLMSFNLGFPAGKPDGEKDASGDQDFIEYFLASIESKFKLILIVEHFDESMVLLKRLMCWGIKDILYHTRNVGRYLTVPPSSKHKTDEEDNMQIYKKWSSVDYQLYDHFKKTFWRKVKEQGSDFYNELRYFKKLNRVVNRFCESLDSESLESYHKMTIANSMYGKSFILDRNFCNSFTSSLADEVRKYYDNLPVPVNDILPNKAFC